MIRPGKRLLAEAGYPHGFEAGDLTRSPRRHDGEGGMYLGAVGIRTQLRTMERAASRCLAEKKCRDSF